MLLDPMFWYGLALKMAMTAVIVVAASFVVERSGAFVGAMIASLPTAAGAVYIILAIEHPPPFVSASAVGSMTSNAAGGIFALTFAVLAQNRSLAASMAGAFAVWFACVGVFGRIPWTATSALALNLAVFPVTIWLGSRFRTDGAKGGVKVMARDIAIRAAIVAVVVAAVTVASHSIGSLASGIFALFPVAMGSFFVILHSRVGGSAAASVAAHLQAPLIGLGFGLLSVHLLAEPVGIWWSYLAALAIGIGWNAMLWIVRERRKIATAGI